MVSIIQIVFLSFAALNCVADETDPYTYFIKKALKPNAIVPAKVTEDNVKLLLFTSSNPTIPQIIDPCITNNLTSSNFNFDLPTKILVHGWLNDISLFQPYKDAYFTVGDYNIILIDWKDPAANSLYYNSAAATVDVGKIVARRLNCAVPLGFDLAKTHCVGFCMGVQVIGSAAKRLTDKFGRVSVLNAAAFGYECPKYFETYDKAYVTFTDAYHTSAGNFGYNTTLGNLDVYVNCGSCMPGCSAINYQCNHFKVLDYYLESIFSSNFKGLKCNKCEEYGTSLCSTANPKILGEGATPITSTEVYYSATNAESPYLKGDDYTPIDNSQCLFSILKCNTVFPI